VHAHSSVLLIPGFEYTDYDWGHVGAAFGDVADALDSGGDFFLARFIEHGGLLTINHPVEKPAASFGPLGWDMSWRAAERRDVPPEISWIHTHAQAIETFNAMVSNLRDRLIFFDEDRSLREAWHLGEAMSREQRRRITPVGGTDSHGEWLRAATFVLAKNATASEIRDAIVNGRTCVRGPEACSLEVRVDGGEWHGVGDAIDAADFVEARAGRAATILVDGEIAARARPNEIVRVALPRKCAFVRAIVGPSWSAPITVGCGF